MANARELKERMASIQETKKITNAMYLISSSKMKQAKKKLADTEPFFYAMQAEITRILRHVPDMHSHFFDRREKIPAKDRKVGCIVITADKGLAGAYNHNVLKMAEELIGQPGKHKMFVLGEVGRQYFSKREDELDSEFKYTVQDPNLYRARVIAVKMVELFEAGELDDIYIIYTRMKNALQAETQQIKLLPLQRVNFASDKMAAMAGVFASHDVSVHSVIQRGKKDGNSVDITYLTHTAREKSVRAVLADIAKLDDVLREEPSVIRVED